MSARGSLALVFDDGFAEDAELVAPVLDDRDAPACFAVPAEHVGADGHLAAEQLRELDAAGHEVVAHGRRHRRLVPYRLADDAAAGDERVPVEGSVFPGEDHCLYPGDEFELADGARTRPVEVAGKGTLGDHDAVALAEPLADGWEAHETVLRPAEATLRDEVVGGGEDLRDLGVDPTTFLFPYDSVSPRAWRLAADEFDAVPNAAVRPLPNPPGTRPTALSRYYLETDWSTQVEIEEYLDAVAATGGLGILAGHSQWETVTAERVGFAIDAARERDLEVVTVRSAAEALRERASGAE